MHIPFLSKVYLCSLYHVMNHHIHTLFLKIIMLIIIPFGWQIFSLEVLCCVKRIHTLCLKIIMVIIFPFGCQIFPLEVLCCVKRKFSSLWIPIIFICNLKPIIFTWTIYNILTPMPNIQNMITPLIVNVLGSKVCKGSIRRITSAQNMLMKQIPLS